jgi:hypothetical protein
MCFLEYILSRALIASRIKANAGSYGRIKDLGETPLLSSSELIIMGLWDIMGFSSRHAERSEASQRYGMLRFTQNDSNPSKS